MRQDHAAAHRRRADREVGGVGRDRRPRDHQADGRLRLRVSGAEPDAVAQRAGQRPVPDGDPAKERRRRAPARARASGSGGTDRVPVGAAASIVRRNAAARRALSRPHSPAPAAADGRAVRRARRAHQDGHERPAASHPSRDQGVGPVRDAFDFGSRLSLRQGHRVQQTAGAGREGDHRSRWPIRAARRSASPRRSPRPNGLRARRSA